MPGTTGPDERSRSEPCPVDTAPTSIPSDGDVYLYEHRYWLAPRLRCYRGYLYEEPPTPMICYEVKDAGTGEVLLDEDMEGG